MTLPPELQFQSADFTARDRTGFGQAIRATVNGQTVTFENLNSSSVVVPWPEYDADGLPIDMFIRGIVTNTCPAPPANAIGVTTFNFPSKSQVFASDPACVLTRLTPDTSPYPPAAPTPAILLTTDVQSYSVTTLPASIDGITYSFSAWDGSQIDNAWIEIISPGAHVSAVFANGNPCPLVAGVWQIGSILSGPLNDPGLNGTHISFTVDQFTACNPPTDIPVTIKYGYSCGGYGNGITQCDPMHSHTFKMHLERSGLAMSVSHLQPGDQLLDGTPLYPPLPCACEHFYQVRLYSTEKAAVLNPGLRIVVPAGMQISSAAYVTSAYDAAGLLVHSLKTFAGCSHAHPPFDQVTFNSAGLTLPTPVFNAATTYAWDINTDVYGGTGMSPGVAYVDLIIGINGCVDNPTFAFHPSGYNLCGGAIPFGSGFEDIIDTFPILKDTVLPEITSVPLGVNQGCNPANLRTDANVQALVIARDNCGGLPTINVTHVDSGPLCARMRKFTITATDGCQNVSVESYVTDTWREDITGPVATTAAGIGNVVVQCGDAAALAAALAFVPSFADNCTLVPAVNLQSDVTTVALCGYSRVRTWTAIDECLNTSLSYVQMITAVDTTPPVFVNCPANVDLGCNPLVIPDGDPNVTATDNCGLANGDLLVSSRATNRVKRYNGTTGVYINDFDPTSIGGLAGPRGLGFGRFGHLFVTSETDEIKEYDVATGAYLGNFVTAGLGGLSAPNGLVFGGSNGNLFVSSVNTNNVKQYDRTTGAYLGNFAATGLNGPRGLVFDSVGLLYVSSLGNSKVMRYPGNQTFTTITSLFGLTFGPDTNLYVSRVGSSLLSRFNSAGVATNTQVDPTNLGGLTNPRGLTFGRDGFLFVGDTTNNMVNRYNVVTCTFIDHFVPQNSGGLSSPTYLIFAPPVTYTKLDTVNGAEHKRKITYTATDRCGNTSTCVQEITWRVNAPPVIAGCTDITRPCTSDTGAMVEFACPTATSPCCPAGTVTVSCDTPSPHQFPIGVTPVTCTATDTCGRTTTCIFTVTVLGHGPGQWTWAKKGGGTAGASGKAVAVDAEGNVFATGSFANTMSFQNSSISLVAAGTTGGNDIFVAKYDRLGTLLWARRAGGVENDAGRGVTVDDTGNAYVTGDYRGTAAVDFGNGSILPGTLGGSDIFVAKYNPSGNCVWVKSMGGTGDDYGTGIAWTPVGDKVYATGAWVFASSTQEAFVLQLNAADGLSPVTFFSTGFPGHSAIGRAIAVDATNGVYVTGSYAGGLVLFGTVSVPAFNTGFGRIFAVKLAATTTSFIPQWLRHGSFSTNCGNNIGSGIAVDSASTTPSVYITGSFQGTIDFGNGFALQDNKSGLGSGSCTGQINDYYIVKLAAATGAPTWAIKGGDDGTVVGQGTNDETLAISLDAAGNPCVTGFRHASATTPFIGEGPTVLAASYNSSAGSLRWMNNAEDVPAGAPADVGRGIAVDGAGCVHVTGDFTEVLDFSPAGQLTPIINGVATNGRDMFVAKMCPLCSCDSPNLIVNGSFETPVIAAGMTNVQNGVTGLGWTGHVGSCGTNTAGSVAIWHGVTTGLGNVNPQDGNQQLVISSPYAANSNLGNR